jgi:hypothetical protein
MSLSLITLRSKCERTTGPLPTGVYAQSVINARAILRFPPEIFHRIVEHAALLPVGAGGDQFSQLHISKLKLSSVVCLASASKLLRAIVLEYWARSLNILNHEDPIRLLNLGQANNTNLLQCVRPVQKSSQTVCYSDGSVVQAPSVRGSVSSLQGAQ